MPPAPSFDLLVQAMNEPRREHVAAAFTADATIDRYTPGDEGELRESYAGLDEIERWLRRTPTQYKFAVVGALRESPANDRDDDDAGAAAWISEYAIRGPEFENGGHWHARFDDEGRIRWLRHHPFALRE